MLPGVNCIVICGFNMTNICYANKLGRFLCIVVLQSLAFSGCRAQPDCGIVLTNESEDSWEWNVSVPESDTYKVCLAFTDFDNIRDNPHSFLTEQTLHSDESTLQISQTDADTFAVSFLGDMWEVNETFLQSPDSGWSYVTPSTEELLVPREAAPLLEFHYHEAKNTDHSRCKKLTIQFMAVRDYIQ